MTNIGVGPALRHARHHRQDRLLAVERLDLALLVDAEHQRPVGRRQVEPDDVANLVDEQRIARQLECLASDAAAVRRPSRSGGSSYAKILSRQPSSGSTSESHRSASSAACARSRRPPDHRRSSAAGPAGPRPASPRHDPCRKRRRHLPTVCSCTPSSAATDLARDAVGAAQNDPASLRHGSRHPPSPNLPFQIVRSSGAQHQRRHRSPRRIGHRPRPLIGTGEPTYNETNFSSR